MSLHWQGGGQGQPGHNPMMRASDTDRERAADVLKAGFAEGRLTKEEYSQRLHRVHGAATYADLQPLVCDLPQGPVPMAGSQPSPLPVPQTVLPYQPGPQHWSPPPVATTNSSAVGAVVCAVLTPLTWGLTSVPGVVLGHKARAEIRRSGERGDGLALSGLIVGYLAMSFWALVLMVAVAAVY